MPTLTNVEIRFFQTNVGCQGLGEESKPQYIGTLCIKILIINLDYAGISHIRWSLANWITRINS